MKGKNILILAPFYPPNIGGAETFAEGLAKHLSDGNYVDVLAFKSFNGRGGSNEGSWFDEKDPAGWHCTGSLEIFRMDWQFKMGKAWKGTGIKNFFRIVPRMLWEAIRLCRQRDYDIVYCNGLNAGFIGAILKVLFKYDVRCILLALYGFNGKFGVLSTVAKWVLKRMDKIYVEGFGGYDEVRSLGITIKKIRRFKHWVDQDIFKPESHGGYIAVGEGNKKILKEIAEKRKMKALFVGRPIYEKGIHIVKQVAGFLKDEVDFEYIEDVPNKSLAEYYQKADVLVVPSIYSEGFVRVVAEGSSCGCAVITSDQGSLPEMVKDFGMIFDASDYHGLLEIISSLAHHRESLRYLQRVALAYAKDNFNEKNAGVFSSRC